MASFIETATQRIAREAKGITLAEAMKIADNTLDAVIVEVSNDELQDVRDELDTLGIEYSPMAKLKSLKKKLNEAKD